MVVTKRVKQMMGWGLLVLLAGALPSVSGQAITSTRVGLSTNEGGRFIVDGQIYNSPQNFTWPVGSSHIVQFPFTPSLDGSASTYQYSDDQTARWSFSGWTFTTTAPLQPSNGPIVTFIADASLTAVTGAVTTQFPLTVTFPANSPDTANCAAVALYQGIVRQGVLFIDGTCYSNSTLVWVSAGNHTFAGYGYPGYLFTGVMMGNQSFNEPPAFNMAVTSKSNIGPIFSPAKRVRFTSNPPGLQLLIDRATITTSTTLTSPLDPIDYTNNCSPDFSYIPVNTPSGIPPLCAGDFDFLPGSAHVIAAPASQLDLNQNYWVLDHFSNGLAQNGIYITPSDTSQPDQIQGIFVHGVVTQIIPSTFGLKVEIDGTSNYPGPNYGFVWGEGQTHHLKAPLTQTDSKGRVWTFVSWSDNGAPEHDITIPFGSPSIAIRANFAELGQITITSTPPGIQLTAAGSTCTTPCTFNQSPGATFSATAPTSLPIGSLSRYDFDGWAGGPAGVNYNATFNTGVQTFNAQFHVSNLLVVTSDPDGGATFTFSPASPDGFYPTGTAVQVSVVPNTGYKFVSWDGDLSGTFSPGRITLTGPASAVAHLTKTPGISPAGIRNAAGDTPDGTVAPGSIISIYGAQLSSQLLIGPINPLAQALGNTYVTVGSSILPLIFVSPNQINAQVPSALTDGTYTLTVHQIGSSDISATFNVKRDAPGVYYNVTQSGMPLVAALHDDGTPITEANPARRGEVVTFFGTGLGPFTQPAIDGFILPSNPIYQLADPVKILAGIPAPPTPPGATPAAQAPPAVRDPAFAAGAAGMVGTSLIKVAIDPDLPAGNVLELYISVNGAQSNRVQLPVQ